jgi:hypothetical protein
MAKPKAGKKFKYDLETVLKGSSSPKLKERALFVLTQVDTPQARAALTAVAKGQGNPDLQLRAVRYLGMHRGEENIKLLVEIYKSTSDTDVKRQVIQSLTMGGSFGRYAIRVRNGSGPVVVSGGVGAGQGTGAAGPLVREITRRRRTIFTSRQGKHGGPRPLSERSLSPEMKSPASKNFLPH